jgi:glycerol-3-phosphate dehydrogenase
MATRQEIIAHLKQNAELSVLIVGGGINGIGTFRDLALNGLDVLLVERADFCSGASAASSHMAHGGIRYLENGEFRLVCEAVQERNRMIQNAPHLVKPLPTTIPIYRRFSGLFNAPLKFLRLMDKPGERGAYVIKLGLLLYDAYTGRKRAVPRHQFLRRAASLTRWPDLNPMIVRTATYYDGAILSPERLSMELILDAEAENPKARALNYVNLWGGQKDTVVLRDELANLIIEVRPKLLINATGAWIDASNRRLGLSTRLIGGTKGSHLVLDHPQLRAAIGEHEFFFENKDGRIVLIFPLYERVLIGSSDLPIDNPDDARCTDEEIDYFLSMIPHVFPHIQIKREQIVFQFSGVRPLPYSSTKMADQISRDHSIQVIDGEWTGLDFPIYSLVGGKWTSYRAFSEQVTDKTLEYLGLSRRKQTRDLPIGGGRGYSRSPEELKRQMQSVSAWTGLSLERIQGLYQRYGTRADAVADYIQRGQDVPLNSLVRYSQREIAFLGRYEKVIHLEDLVLRRTMLAMLGLLTRTGIDELAEVLGNALDWEQEQKKDETRRTLSILADKHRVFL